MIYPDLTSPLPNDRQPMQECVSEEVEEEIDRCIFHGNTFGIANYTVIGIPDRTVTTDPAQDRLVAIPDSPVVVDVAQDRVISVTHSVTVYLCQ